MRAPQSTLTFAFDLLQKSNWLVFIAWGRSVSFHGTYNSTLDTFQNISCNKWKILGQNEMKRVFFFAFFLCKFYSNNFNEFNENRNVFSKFLIIQKFVYNFWQKSNVMTLVLDGHQSVVCKSPVVNVTAVRSANIIVIAVDNNAPLLFVHATLPIDPFHWKYLRRGVRSAMIVIERFGFETFQMANQTNNFFEFVRCEKTFEWFVHFDKLLHLYRRKSDLMNDIAQCIT